MWFLLGYAFYAAAFAVAGALVPRQEELQSSTTPLTMLILISLFAGFIVIGDPEGTLAHVCAFIPTTAPITMPGRIVLGAAPAWEIAASVAVMIVSTMALIPLAGRIYAAVVLRTGSSVKLSEALRLAAEDAQEAQAHLACQAKKSGASRHERCSVRDATAIARPEVPEALEG